jgi:undecaprenyl-diphosphatase
MQVFGWEQDVSDFAASLPRSGLLFDFMHFMSHPKHCGILFWSLLFVLWFHRELKASLQLLIVSLIAAGIGDLCSRRLIKVFVLRLRPHYLNEACNRAHCWGFVSSHATNIAAFSVVFCLHDRRNLWWAVPVVTLVLTSRIYLLDHYPLDVIGGVALGLLIGKIVFALYSKLKGGLNKSKV